MAASPAGAATTGEQLAGKRYVAIGDSYASGYGLPPYAPTPAPGCLQSADSIAHRIAATYDLDVTDVSCSGATIANVLSTPQNVPGGSVPAQLDAVTADTALVSVMIGGNDAGFSTVLPSCLAASPSGPLIQDPTAASCAAKYGGQVSAAIQGVVAPALDAMLAAIHQKAPDARVILLGYPAISPSDAAAPAAGCFSSALGTGQPPLPQNSFPFAEADRAFIASLSAQLDDAQRAAAERNGAAFVSVLADSDAHTPCAGTAAPYLNGITLASLTPPTPAAGALHPNAAGADFLTAALQSAIETAFPETVADSGDSVDSTTPGDVSVASVQANEADATTELAATGADARPGLLVAALGLLVGAVLLLGNRRRSLR